MSDISAELSHLHFSHLISRKRSSRGNRAQIFHWTSAVVKSLLNGHNNEPLSSQHEREMICHYIASSCSRLRHGQAVNGRRKPQQSSAVKHEIDTDCHANKVGTGCGPSNQE